MSSDKPTRPSDGPSGPARPGLGARLGPAAFRDARFNPYRIGAVVVALAAAIAAATYVGDQSSGDGGTTVAQRSTTPSESVAPSPSATPLSLAQAYKNAVATDFTGISSQFITYSQTLQGWQRGEPNDSELNAIFDLALVNFAESRDMLAKRETFEQAPQVLENFRSSAALFLESARIGKAALGVPTGALRDQLRNQVQRLRTLGDRTFDQANAELAPFLPDQGATDPGVDVRGAAEVPEFVSAGFAPGAPLDTVPAKPAQPRVQIEDKPQEDVSAWASRVTGLTPSAQDLTSAISGGSATQLRDLARRFTSASDQLYTEPDPRDGHLANVRVQLGLLVDAEAARAAQAATLLSGQTQASLRTSAQRLALIGDRMWDQRLGQRSTGFPQTLLTGS